MTRRKRVKWNYGDVFLVPLVDGTFGIGQAIDSMMPNIVYCTLLGLRFQSRPNQPPQLKRDDVISLIAVWKDSLNFGLWPVIGTSSLVVKKEEFPNEEYRRKGYVGAKHYDAGLAEDFLSAYHGLIPWNVMHGENYYEKILRVGFARPTSAVILSPEARQKYRLEKGWEE